MSSKTKEQLKKDMATMQEKLYIHGIERRPTMMAAICDVETDYRRKIAALIQECELKTGRAFQYHGPIVLASPKSNRPMCEEADLCDECERPGKCCE